MTEGIFITGTDTGVGKTTVSYALLRKYVAAGSRAVDMKPVAAGGGEEAAAIRAAHCQHTMGSRGCAGVELDRRDRSESQFFESSPSMLKLRGFS